MRNSRLAADMCSRRLHGLGPRQHTRAPARRRVLALPERDPRDDHGQRLRRVDVGPVGQRRLEQFVVDRAPGRRDRRVGDGLLHVSVRRRRDEERAALRAPVARQPVQRVGGRGPAGDPDLGAAPAPQGLRDPVVDPVGRATPPARPPPRADRCRGRPARRCPGSPSPRPSTARRRPCRRETRPRRSRPRRHRPRAMRPHRARRAHAREGSGHAEPEQHEDAEARSRGIGASPKRDREPRAPCRGRAASPGGARRARRRCASYGRAAARARGSRRRRLPARASTGRGTTTSTTSIARSRGASRRRPRARSSAGRRWRGRRRARSAIGAGTPTPRTRGAPRRPPRPSTAPSTAGAGRTGTRSATARPPTTQATADAAVARLSLRTSERKIGVVAAAVPDDVDRGRARGRVRCPPANATIDGKRDPAAIGSEGCATTRPRRRRERRSGTRSRRSASLRARRGRGRRRARRASAGAPAATRAATTPMNKRICDGISE